MKKEKRFFDEIILAPKGERKEEEFFFSLGVGQNYSASRSSEQNLGQIICFRLACLSYSHSGLRLLNQF